MRVIRRDIHEVHKTYIPQEFKTFDDILDWIEKDYGLPSTEIGEFSEDVDKLNGTNDAVFLKDFSKELGEEVLAIYFHDEYEWIAIK
jgi:hypothetical protein